VVSLIAIIVMVIAARLQRQRALAIRDSVAAMVHRSALVTGASSGMGHGLALALASRKVHVLCAARRRDRLDELVGEIQRAGGSAEAVELDVADASTTFEIVRELDRKHELDLIIANAGVGDFTRARAFRFEDAKRVMDVNVLGAIATLSGALDGMLTRKRGQIVGVASVAGFLPGVPGLSSYAASKAALVSFLGSLRIELEGSGVVVTTVCPGYVQTEMTAGNKSQSGMLSVEAAVEHIMTAIEREDAVRVFPRGMAMTVAMTPLMPSSLYSWIVRRQTKGL
jgi:short-subunit dehydrogenase